MGRPTWQRPMQGFVMQVGEYTLDRRPPVNRQHVMQLFLGARPGLKERFGVQELAIFGSVARDEIRLVSDVDVLVTFEG